MSDILKQAIKKRTSTNPVRPRRCWWSGTKDEGPWFDIKPLTKEVQELAEQDAKTGEYLTEKSNGFRTRQVPVIDDGKRAERLVWHLLDAWGDFKVRDMLSFLPTDSEVDLTMLDEPVDVSDGNREVLSVSASGIFGRWVIGEATDLAAFHGQAEVAATENFRGARPMVVASKSAKRSARVDEAGAGGEGG